MPQQYSDKLKDHYRHPRNIGRIADYTHSAERINPLCGDEIRIYLKLKKDKIADLSYEARGCLICLAGASAVSEYARGRKLETIKKLDSSKVAKLLEAEISAAREQCAMLFLKALAGQN